MIGEGRGNQKEKPEIGVGQNRKRVIFHIIFIIHHRLRTIISNDKCNMENG
jgi:hypothetical protein